MLVLTRKANEEIMIGDNIVVSIVKVSGGKIKIGVTAPTEISVKRAEKPQEFAEMAKRHAAEELPHGDNIKVDCRLQESMADALTQVNCN
ncbi:MAG: carbon storage regulator [Selenomonas sp.]|uniref:carbon storage regulator n=1 Tax=Selenomonas sp. AE3005 TaxID=1485543 RepID=UPI000488C2E1|nr:carbon storage regulator [Selenomonas sp. AE3005]MBQ1416866.1 carbon storage regulator [Selenomonas sp.]MBQ1462380.1 carbon storage regulator [Selenomonas sp.]MBQ1614641.1 carbon storage regulator [Selenomonas sp.]MBQ1808833.1 carbon storage regulator [Selenomonas sp.]MBQ1919144.1 carbon storage regulator [Selenomonas sp.]